MVRVVYCSGLVVLGIVIVLMVFCVFVVKDVVVVVGLNFIMFDLYDVNDMLFQVVVKLFYQGLFGLDKEMKLKNVLVESYIVFDDGFIYIVKLWEGIKFQDGIDFNVVVVKVNLDWVSDLVNYFKCYNLYKNIVKMEVIDLIMVKIIFKQLFLVFINIFVYLVIVMILLVVLEKYGKEIGFYLVGIGLYELDIWNQIDFVKVKKFVGYWQSGLFKLDSIIWCLVVDNNICVVML